MAERRVDEVTTIMFIAEADFRYGEVKFQNSTRSYEVTIPMFDWKALGRPDRVKLRIIPEE